MHDITDDHLGTKSFQNKYSHQPPYQTLDAHSTQISRISTNPQINSRVTSSDCIHRTYDPTHVVGINKTASA
jgi:hypothetical protein